VEQVIGSPGPNPILPISAQGLSAIASSGEAGGFRQILFFTSNFTHFLLKAVLGNFSASPGFGFTKKNSTSHWDGGAFVKAD
jgi:hypothetical protein